MISWQIELAPTHAANHLSDSPPPPPPQRPTGDRGSTRQPSVTLGFLLRRCAMSWCPSNLQGHTALYRPSLHWSLVRGAFRMVWPFCWLRSGKRGDRRSLETSPRYYPIGRNFSQASVQLQARVFASCVQMSLYRRASDVLLDRD
jgi:hypothetical protein